RLHKLPLTLEITYLSLALQEVEGNFAKLLTPNQAIPWIQAGDIQSATDKCTATNFCNTNLRLNNFHLTDTLLPDLGFLSLFGKGTLKKSLSGLFQLSCCSPCLFPLSPSF